MEEVDDMFDLLRVLPKDEPTDGDGVRRERRTRGTRAEERALLRCCP